MIRHRSHIWLCLLCVLALSGLTSQAASAATKGQTAFTCVKGQGTLKGQHCLTTGGAAAEYGHVAIAENTTTELSITNAQTANETKEAGLTRLKETIGGVELELTATGVFGSGTIVNKKDGATGEHFAEGEAVMVLEGVTVAKPAGKGCDIYTEPKPNEEGAKGTIKIQVKTKTYFLGIRFLPIVTVISNFMLTCSFTKIPALEGSWEVTGGFNCPANGATDSCSHSEVTTQNTLKGKGNKMGIEGALTFSARANSGQSYTPLSLTAVETP
jgi:hypothetical protein